MPESPAALTAGIPRETFPGERRVAAVPASIAALTKAGLKVVVEAGAGTAAGFPDAQYTKAGAKVLADRDAVFAEADLLLMVRACGANPEAGRSDLELLRSGQTLVATCDPLTDPAPLQTLAGKHVTSFALELLPRITRAQSMDVLSSMATVAGYKAVLIAANRAPRMFPLLMTAAGTVKPARVLVVGAGVAGLQAIATAKRLGAIVHGYDIRPAVKEQVESLGGKFVELELEAGQSETSGGYAREMDEEFYRKQRELMAKVVAASDVVITTAAVPGKKAPVLVTAEMVRGMAPGSLIVDLAAERGGNCELTIAGETVEEEGVSILGPTNLASDIPYHASEMFSRNMATFVALLVQEGQIHLNLDDEIIRETLLTNQGEVVHAAVRSVLGLPPVAGAGEHSPAHAEAEAARKDASPSEASATLPTDTPTPDSSPDDSGTAPSVTADAAEPSGIDADETSPEEPPSAADEGDSDSEDEDSPERPPI